MVRQFRPSVRMSFRPSVTRVDFIKTAEHIIIEILSLSDRPAHDSSFRHQGWLRKSDGFTPNGGTEYNGGSNFQPICGYIMEMVIVRGIFTVEDEYKFVCALLNSAVFDDLELPEPQFQGHSIVSRRISRKRCIRSTPCSVLC